MAARHEGGHVAVGRAVGGEVLGAQIFPDGSGVTYVRLPRSATAVQEIAVCVAGEVAAGTSTGCQGDQADVATVLATLPPGQRAGARRAGYAQAAAVLGGFFSDGGASAAAARLLERGRL